MNYDLKICSKCYIKQNEKMGWRVIKTYAKECGCECEDAENDVDRPFMCYTEYDTTVTKRCDKRSQQHEEYCAKQQAER